MPKYNQNYRQECKTMELNKHNHHKSGLCQVLQTRMKTQALSVPMPNAIQHFNIPPSRIFLNLPQYEIYQLVHNSPF